MKSVTGRKSGRWDGTMRERKKKENEKVDKKNRVLEWGSNPVCSDCASGGATVESPQIAAWRNVTRSETTRRDGRVF